MSIIPSFQVLTSVQVRRFQVRFASHDDYYEAMKILSRANIPTLEAGAFPAHRPQTAPKLSSSRGIGIDDSVSHHTNRPISTVADSGQALQNVGWRANAAMSSTSVSGVAQASSYVMQVPPSRLATPGQPDHSYHSHGAASRSSPRFHNAGLERNSLVPSSSSKTLVTEHVADIQSDVYKTPSHESSHPTQVNVYTPRPFAAPATPSLGLDQALPPRRELPFKVAKATLDGSTSNKVQGDISGTKVTARSPGDSHGGVPERQEDGLQEQPHLETGGKASRKRAAPKSAPKAPASKKPKSTASRKKATAKQGDEATPVP